MDGRPRLRWVLEKRRCCTNVVQGGPIYSALCPRSRCSAFLAIWLNSRNCRNTGGKTWMRGGREREDGMDGFTWSLRPSLQSIGLSIDSTSCPGMSVSELCTAHSTSSLKVIAAQVVDRQSTIGPRAIPGRRRNACGKPWATTGTIVANDDQRLAGGHAEFN